MKKIVKKVLKYAIIVYNIPSVALIMLYTWICDPSKLANA